MARKKTEPVASQVADLREKLAPVVEHAAAVARQQAAVARQQAAVARERAAQAGGQAAVAAGQAREWAAPRVGHAVEEAAARWEKGLQAAAPRVEAAAERVVPAVDAARDRIVEDLLPRIVEAVGAAAAAGLAARDAAAEAGAGLATTVGERVEDAAQAIARSTPAARRKAAARRTRIAVVALGAVALAAGAAAFKRSRGHDPEVEHVATGVPHSEKSRRGASETGTGVPASGGLGSTTTAAEAFAEEPVGEAAPLDAPVVDLTGDAAEPTEPSDADVAAPAGEPETTAEDPSETAQGSRGAS